MHAYILFASKKYILKLGEYVQKEIQEIVDNSSLSYQEMKSMAELLIVYSIIE